MNKKFSCVLALMLCVSLLCGCGAPGALAGLSSPDREDYAVRELCVFEDMPYERPDLDALEDMAAQLEEALAGKASYRKVTKLLDEVYGMYNSFETMATIADIRNCQDLSDEFYAGEYAWCLAAQAEVDQIMEEVYLSCGASRLAERLAEEYFWDGFLEEYGPENESLLTDEYVELAPDLLLLNGDGLTAFDGAKVLLDSVKLDSQMLIEYITSTLGGEIGAQYADLTGEDRIVIK